MDLAKRSCASVRPWESRSRVAISVHRLDWWADVTLNAPVATK